MYVCICVYVCVCVYVFVLILITNLQTTGYQNAVKILDNMKNKEFMTFCERSRKNPANNGLSLNDFLIKPIQRLCKVRGKKGGKRGKERKKEGRREKGEGRRERKKEAKKP